MARWRLVTALAVASLSAAAVGIESPPAGADQEMVLVATRGSDKGYENYQFAIQGSPTKLFYPGTEQRMTLTFSNPFAFPVRIHSVDGRLVATDKRRCLPVRDNLQVKNYDGRLPLTVGARGRAKGGSIALFMPNSVANGCQNATFRIKFTAGATKVGR
jgi:hypothetical protein